MKLARLSCVKLYEVEGGRGLSAVGGNDMLAALAQQTGQAWSKRRYIRAKSWGGVLEKK